MGCAHSATRAPVPVGQAIHVGWARSGLFSVHEEIIVRDDGLMCLYTNGSLYAGRLRPEATQAVFDRMRRSELPLRPVTTDQVGNVPGGGGCTGPQTRGMTLTLASRGGSARGARVLIERVPLPMSTTGSAFLYREGDLHIEGRLYGWWTGLLDAADGVQVLPLDECRATLITGVVDRRGRSRVTDRRVFWPVVPATEDRSERVSSVAVGLARRRSRALRGVRRRSTSKGLQVR